MTRIRFPYPVETDTNSVTDGYGTKLKSQLDYGLCSGTYADLANRKLPIVKPEDFEGETMAEKVIAANEFILNAGGGFELYFGDSPTYLITQAIVIPSNTTIRLNGCTIQLANNTVDNMFRTANIEIDPDNPYGFAKNKTSMERVYNIKLIGENDPVLLMVDVTNKYGERNWGWRAHTVEFVGVQNFEIGGYKTNKNIAWQTALTGCCYGSVHDIEFNSTRDNGDGIDVEFGSHDIEIYNISGKLSDDVIAVANSGPSRLVRRPTELEKPTCPYDYGWRKFGEETHNIHIYNVNATTFGGNVIDLICGDYGIHDISIGKISDNNNDIEQGTVSAIVVVIGGQYDGGYHHGLIHNVSINDISAYDCGRSVIYLNEAIIKNCRINDVKLADGQTLIDNMSGANLADYNFSITNVSTLSQE